MQFVRQKIHLGLTDIQIASVGYSVVDLSVKRLHIASIVACLQSVPFAPGGLGRSSLLWDRPTPVGTLPSSAGLSGSASCLSLRATSNPPRRARRLLVNVSSPPATGFSISGSMATLIWCNEAESSSLVLRLTGSPLRASAWGLLLSPPHRLLAVHSSNKFISFHMNRQLRFILTHRITPISQMGK